ncbi:hypothetical protein SAMD00019534_012770, partial [Acytostelium subglobosum LB1]|uniref:hypothetical protein n=1 Tax=Acytostelium subglobosum LB1 TaxID=1410327 RepID=UPI000644BB46
MYTLILLLLLLSCTFITAQEPEILSISYGVNVGVIYGNNLDPTSLLTVSVGYPWTPGVNGYDLQVNYENYLHNVTFFYTDEVPLYGRIAYMASNRQYYQIDLKWTPIYVNSATKVPTQGGDITLSGATLNSYMGKSNWLTFDQYGIQFQADANSVTPYINIFHLGPTNISGNKIKATIKGYPFDQGVIRNQSLTLSVAPPYIDQVLIDGNNNIQINGGSFSSNVSFVTVLVDGYQMLITGFTAHYNITLGYNQNSTYPLNSTYFNMPGVKSFTVIVDGLASEIPYNISIRPIISKVSSVSSATGGVVTIYGPNLSKTNWNGSPITVIISLGKLTCDYNSSLPSPPGSLPCTAPASPGIIQTDQGAPVDLIINGIVGNHNVYFLYDNPTLDTTPFQFGQLIGIAGDFLGNISDITTTKVTINNNQTLAPLTIKKRQFDGRQVLVFAVPDGTALGTTLNLTITNNFNHTSLVSYVVIQGMNVVVADAPVDGGPVSITGTPADMFKNVHLGDIAITQCVSIPGIDATGIKCILPKGTGKNHSLSIAYMEAATQAFKDVSYRYGPPVIISATSVDLNGGSITIIGQNFATVADLAVSIGSVKCTQVKVINSQTLTCTLNKDDLPSPLPIDQVQTINVTVSEQQGSATVFQYSKPTVAPSTTGNPSHGNKLSATTVILSTICTLSLVVLYM